MEISAVMNVQELAVNKALRLHADAQDRQLKCDQQKDSPGTNETSALGTETTLEKAAGALSNAPQQQLDPQSTSSRVERQVDTQAAKETAQGTGADFHETGNYLDIVT